MLVSFGGTAKWLEANIGSTAVASEAHYGNIFTYPTEVSGNTGGAGSDPRHQAAIVSQVMPASQVLPVENGCRTARATDQHDILSQDFRYESGSQFQSASGTPGEPSGELLLSLAEIVENS